MKSGIYVIRNTENNKVYVGSAKNISKRWHIHLSHLKQHKHHSQHLQRAWNLQKGQGFELEIIEEVVDYSLLLSREQHYIALMKSSDRKFGYNVCKVAGSPLGLTRSSATKRKISCYRKGKKFNQSVLHKLRTAKGKPKGYYKCKNRYCAEIRIDGTKKYLGSFPTPEEAHQAYMAEFEKYEKKLNVD